MEIKRVLVHPVRSRIIATMSGREMTRAELEARMPDVPAPTVYRNLRVLLDAGVVETVAANPKRGAKELVYAVVPGRSGVTLGQAQEWSPSDWQAGLDTFLASISAGYRNYLAEGGKEPCPASGAPVLVTDEERMELMRRMYEIVGEYQALPPSPERRRWMVSMVVQPDEA